MYRFAPSRRCHSAEKTRQTSVSNERQRLPRLLSAKDIRSSLGIQDSVLHRSQYAYITLVSTGDRLSSALLLGWSLRRTGTKFDCIAMVLPDICHRTRTMLQKVYSRVVEVDSIKIHQGVTKLQYLPVDERDEFSQRLAKCNAFKFVEYKKILFIDNSTYIVRKIDELFELEAPAGISSLVDSAGQTQYHGMLLSRDHTTKALQFSRGIRGTMLLLTPSLALLHYCHTYKGRYSDPHFIRHDEEFLTKLFLGQWTHIHSKFASIPWQANRIRCEIYGVCLEGFRPWKDDCKNSDEINQWRLNAVKMTREIPHTRRIFKNQLWFIEMEQSRASDQ